MKASRGLKNKETELTPLPDWTLVCCGSCSSLRQLLALPYFPADKVPPTDPAHLWRLSSHSRLVVELKPNNAKPLKQVHADTV